MTTTSPARPTISLDARADQYANPMIPQRQKFRDAMIALDRYDAEGATIAFAALARDIERHGVSSAPYPFHDEE